MSFPPTLPAVETAPRPSGQHTAVLRVPRRAALLAVSVLVAAASLVSFAESYRSLYEWAAHHGLRGIWAALWPLQVDVFIAVGELALFVALVDRWDRRSRAGAWCVTLTGLAVSVAGNIGHVRAHMLTHRATAAVPPLAAAAALAVGLGVLKRVVGRRHENADGTPARPTVTGAAEPLGMDAVVAARQAAGVAPVLPLASAGAFAAAGHDSGHNDGQTAVTDPAATRPKARQNPGQKAARKRPKRPAKRRPAADIEAAARAAMTGQPGISGSDLAAVIGVSERTARRVRARLSAVPPNGHSAADTSKETEPDGTPD